MIRHRAPSQAQLRKALKPLIEENNRRGEVPMVLPQDDWLVKQEDWLQVIILPGREGLHASDFVDRLIDIEKELKKRVQYDQILLVPARPA